MKWLLLVITFVIRDVVKRLSEVNGFCGGSNIIDIQTNKKRLKKKRKGKKTIKKAVSRTVSRVVHYTWGGTTVTSIEELRLLCWDF